MKMLFRPEGGDPGSNNPAGDPPAGDPPADEWKPPENKEAFDKLIGDAVAAAAPKPPDNYDLKLPENAKVDAKIAERTAATARTLGLSNEAAQKTLDFITQEAAAHADQRVQAAIADYTAPTKENPLGGAKWREQDEKWRADSLADKELGAGKQEVLDANIKIAEKVVAKFGDEKLLDFFHQSGLGSHPAALKFLVRLGKSMKESELIPDSRREGTKGKDAVEVMYGEGRGADPRGSVHNEIEVTK